MKSAASFLMVCAGFYLALKAICALLLASCEVSKQVEPMPRVHIGFRTDPRDVPYRPASTVLRWL